jgi:HlyD family secretion protein
MRLRRLLLPLLAVGVIGGGVAASRLRPIEVAIAPEERDVAVTVFGLGSVEAQVVTRIGFEVAGTLVRVAADHGDLVRVGDELAALNPASAEARLARAEAGLQSAEAAAARAEAQRDRAEALSAQKQATARRRRDLANRGVGSQESAELAETEAAAAIADVGVNRADAAVARAAMADAQANVLAERTALAKHRLLAPFDALVVTRHRELGSALNPGEPVFTLVAPDSYWVLAFVDEGRAGRLAVGQPARVVLRSRPGEPMAAEVVRIGLEADRVTEERRVWLRCRGCPGQPVLGEQAEVLIETGRLPRARLLPESALHGFDGAKGTIWTVEDGRLARREIRVAARLSDGRVAIADGLPAGAEPALRAGSGFTLGRAARAVPAP